MTLKYFYFFCVTNPQLKQDLQRIYANQSHLYFDTDPISDWVKDKKLLKRYLDLEVKPLTFLVYNKNSQDDKRLTRFARTASHYKYSGYVEICDDLPFDSICQQIWFWINYWEEVDDGNG